MARGRPQRSGSASSVETVDFSKIRWCHETSVVKSAPKDEDPLYHIVFEVKDVTIYEGLGRDGGDTGDDGVQKFPNLLEVRLQGPFAARGILVIEEKEEDDRQKQLARVMLRNPKQVPIAINTVHQFSIGETEDRRPCIWMLGRCGAWYEIVPSVEYKTTYDLMMEGVYLYYRILDFYGMPEHRAKMPGRRDEITRLFFQYAYEVGDGSTYEDVADRCEKHAPFLFYQFETEKEYQVQLDSSEGRVAPWHATEIYKWLKKRRNDALTTVQRALKDPLILTRDGASRQQATSTSAAPPSLAQLGQQKNALPTTDNAHSPADAETLKARGDAAASPKSASSATTSPSDNDAEQHKRRLPEPGPFVATAPQSLGEEDHAALRSLVTAVQAVSHLKKRPLTATSATQMLYQKYRFPDMRAMGNYRKAVEEVFYYYSKALIEEPSFQQFHGSELYSWVEDLAGKPFKYENLKADKFPFFCVPREKRQKRLDEFEPADVSQSLAADTRGSPSGAGKRPPGRPRKSNLSLATPGRKRPYADMNGTSDDEFDHRRSIYFDDGDETMEEPSYPNNAHGDAEDEPTPVSYGEPIDFVIRAKALDSRLSRRSDGAWVCDRNGCDFVVRGEAESEARKRIKEHVAEHGPLPCNREGCDFALDEEDQNVAQLRLREHILDQHGPWVCDHEGCDFIARRENGFEEERRVQAHIAEHEKQDQKLSLAKSESRPHLPIDHLLEKIRALSQRREEAAHVAGISTDEEPQRIKRKMMA